MSLGYSGECEAYAAIADYFNEIYWKIVEQSNLLVAILGNQEVRKVYIPHLGGRVFQQWLLVTQIKSITCK